MVIYGVYIRFWPTLQVCQCMCVHFGLPELVDACYGLHTRFARVVYSNECAYMPARLVSECMQWAARTFDKSYI